ncbi:MAG TPA: hypothetical protein VJY64_01005 [Candidatus Onthovivens sp.]|nr:hypothetical protein [Candidatus Onthovivens sp.]
MIKRSLIYLSVTILLSGIYYYTVRDLIMTLVLFLIFNLFFFLFVERKYRKYAKIDKRTHECISFINNFIITLSVNNSLNNTFNHIEDSFSKELKAQVETIEHLQIEEKIKYLKDYFNLNLFEVFLKLIDQYNYNGGNILQIAQLLIFDSRKIENSLESFKKSAKMHFIEFFILWTLTIVILIIVQISLSIFYQSILKMDFYKYGVFFFFLVFIGFLFLYLNRLFDLRFVNEGDFKDEKSKKKN